METDGSRIAQLRAAAVAEFHERGYDGATMRSIAERVGIRAPSLYNYVDSKEDLLFEAMRSMLKEILAHIEAAATSGPNDDGDADEQLRRILRAFTLYIVRHPAAAAVSNSELSSLPEDRCHEIIAIRKAIHAVVVQCIARGHVSGRFNCMEPGVISQVILVSLSRTYKWFDPSGGKSDSEVADIVAEYLVAGIRNNREQRTNDI